MKVIAVLNQKGGCGKSTLSMLLSLALASDGKRVLAVDCDPQGGLSSFLVNPDEERPGLFDFLGKFKKLKEVTHPVERSGISFDIIPADYRLDSVASALDPFALKRVFKGVKDYDYVVLDNPPTVQGISRASALFADEIIVPAEISARPFTPSSASMRSRGKGRSSWSVTRNPMRTGMGTCQTFRESSRMSWDPPSPE